MISSCTAIYKGTNHGAKHRQSTFGGFDVTHADNHRPSQAETPLFSGEAWWANGFTQFMKIEFIDCSVIRHCRAQLEVSLSGSALDTKGNHPKNVTILDQPIQSLHIPEVL